MKELDTKKGLNWYDYGARCYDAVVGRFHTQDRFAEKYYHLNPYQYAGNNPVRNVDVNGDSIIIAPNPNGVLDYGRQLFNVDTKYQEQVRKDLEQLKKDDPMVKEMIVQLEESPFTHEITMPEFDRYNATIVKRNIAEKGLRQGTTVYYDPFNKKTKTGNTRTPRAGLAHELQHAFDADAGIFHYEETENGIKIMDVKAINTENKIRKITGDPKRIIYGNQKVPEWLLD